MYFLLYTRQGCSYCDKALKLLSEKKKEYVVSEVEKGSKALLEVQEKYNWKTVPIIFEIRKKEKMFIGGYTDLVEYLK